MIPGVCKLWVWIYINLSNNNTVYRPKRLVSDAEHTLRVSDLTPTVHLFNNSSRSTKKKKKSPNPRLAEENGILSILLAENI